jgi:hypothetical protein
MKKATKAPDFTGQKGELVSAEGFAALHWGGRLKTSPYDALLDQLAAAGAGMLLKFGSVKAKASVYSRAKKKGMRVSFAEQQGTLFVRYDGSAAEDLGQSRRGAIRKQLARGPVALHKLAGALREAGDPTLDSPTLSAILGQMVKAGEVVAREGNEYGLNLKVTTAKAS